MNGDVVKHRKLMMSPRGAIDGSSIDATVAAAAVEAKNKFVVAVELFCCLGNDSDENEVFDDVVIVDDAVDGVDDDPVEQSSRRKCPVT